MAKWILTAMNLVIGMTAGYIFDGYYLAYALGLICVAYIVGAGAMYVSLKEEENSQYK